MGKFNRTDSTDGGTGNTTVTVWPFTKPVQIVGVVALTRTISSMCNHELRLYSPAPPARGYTLFCVDTDSRHFTRNNSTWDNNNNYNKNSDSNNSINNKNNKSINDNNTTIQQYNITTTNDDLLIMSAYHDD